jgi:hypothetical protein
MSERLIVDELVEMTVLACLGDKRARRHRHSRLSGSSISWTL